MAQSVVQSSPSGLEAAAAGASSLEIVTDANFGEAVLAASKRGPVLLEFYGEYCGPCRQCEPALKQLDASFAELKVVKARLNSNPAFGYDRVAAEASWRATTAFLAEVLRP